MSPDVGDDVFVGVVVTQLHLFLCSTCLRSVAPVVASVVPREINQKRIIFQIKNGKKL